MLHIREATEADFEKIWPIFHAITSAGDTYAYPPDVTKSEGKRLWLDLPRKTFVAENDNEFCWVLNTSKPIRPARVPMCVIAAT